MSVRQRPGDVVEVELGQHLAHLPAVRAVLELPELEEPGRRGALRGGDLRIDAARGTDEVATKEVVSFSRFTGG
jgi:hypothetical protein